jgi:hypothetical protein
MVPSSAQEPLVLSSGGVCVLRIAEGHHEGTKLKGGAVGLSVQVPIVVAKGLWGEPSRNHIDFVPERGATMVGQFSGRTPKVGPRVIAKGEGLHRVRRPYRQLIGAQGPEGEYDIAQEVEGVRIG